MSRDFRSSGLIMFRFMPGRERLKDSLTRFNHFLHSLGPRRRRSPSPNRPITPTLDPQVSSTPDPASIPDTQPLKSPSFSNIHPSTVIGPAGNEVPGRMAIGPALDSQASSTSVGPDPTSIHDFPDTQPLYSPSLSNIYPSIVIGPAGNEVPGRMAVGSTLDPKASSTPVGPDSTSIPGIPDIQPLYSPPLSNIYPSIVIGPDGDEAPGRMAELARTGFQGVKTTLQLIERATDVFPPLKSTVAGLLGVIDIVEVRKFQLSVVIVIMLTVPRQPLRTNKIAKIWSRS